ncbi:MAG: trypsin-like peptidase domain-containing protein [Mangrovimonas sp.]|nr:trypsin-like peptidase domain-containing protein [Mangrovimonas sp.]MCB0539461.1 trypsin-like peptidase domain-containing protein [Bacteroidota bacterium]
MQLPKMILGLLTLMVFLLSCRATAQSNQVLRIKSSNCAYNTKGATTNFATGFVYKENGRVVGVITALHAVCGCSSISAEDNSGTDFFSLKVSKADIENDIALLTSSEITSNFSTGLEFSDLNTSTLANREISMFAYPYGIELNIDTKNARVRETPTALLKKFVKSDVEDSLKIRGSPNINKYVLNLQLEITPGCSGAPILYGNKVIGVANGGLDKGRTHVCWAIPTRNIQLTSVSNLEPSYSNLRRMNPNTLFVLTCDIEGKEPSDCPKIETKIFESTSGYSNRPSVKVVVPEGYKIIGGGAKVTYNGSGCLITESYPNGSSWVAKAKDHLVGSNASITAYAIALYDPNNQWDVRVFQTTGSTANYPEATVRVEDGYVMTGGGAKDNWSGAGNLLTASYPLTNDTWKAKGKDHGNADRANITVYVIGIKPTKKCSKKLKNKIFQSTSDIANHPSGTVSVNRNYYMVGGGTISNWSRAGNLLTSSYPSSNREWSGSSKDLNFAESVSLDIYGIGIRFQ